MNSCFRNAQLAWVAAFGLLMTAPGCGSDASSAVRARRSAPAEQPFAANPSTSPASLLAGRDPSGIARAQRARQDPPPERPSTREACDACQGLWGVHGIEDVETCICRTNDEGHECIDGNQCQGECLLAEDAEFHVMDQGDPPRGYYVGSCSGYDVTFGCFRHVPSDVSSELPLTPEEAGPFVCAD